MSSKETNPKDAIGTRKVAFSTLPAQVIGELAVAMTEGALKYGKFNYRVIGVRASVYYDACLRHLLAWHEGQDEDPDSGLSHLVKAMSCLLVLRDAQRQGMLTDDRPPLPSEGWVDELNELTAELRERYPNPPPAFTKAQD